MRKMLLTAVAVGLLVLPVAASAQQLFDFNGQALIPASAGGDITMVAQVTNGAVIDTPIALDFANFEYTMVITGLTLITDGTSQFYSGGTLTLYEDDQTVADYTSMASFMDGTALLVGTISLQRESMLPTLGSIAGDVDWTGGTRIGEFAPGDQLGWKFFSVFNKSATVTQPGYDENWDGKCEPTEPVVANEPANVGEVKSRY